MIEAIEKNLQRGISLLNTISNEQYSDSSVAPYFSSIGCHMRHILDVFSCVFEGLETKSIYLNKRNRNELLELHTQLGIEYFNETIQKLKEINTLSLESTVLVTDDLGLGVKSVNYTLAAILMQAHSHAIHHFASIGYIIYQLGIELPDADFGFNPTTPKVSIERS
ncbi:MULTISPECIES: DinB family protein [unclassified Polaribacter]|uniref:DinB family protein n=1 Tax=unclassified Polaribacter TaxID=196858 RepID=UPI001C4FD689|nr:MULTISPECIES: DinB family protein [unclassified Polaribacter]QXP68388.1 DinB family protein [Polaribacter sp. AHE13PA]QXP70563.1 DinB family protein [Polaribacter sp. R2A056_3_33]